jgi:hypothetical protein
MNREFGGHGMRGWQRWRRRPHDLQAARANELTGQGNPPGLWTRGFLPRWKWASIPKLVGFQRAQRIGPGETSTVFLGQGNCRDPSETMLPE